MTVNKDNKKMSNGVYQMYKEAMDKKKILSSKVKIVEHDDATGSEVLVLDLNGIKAVIPRNEVDNEVEWKSLIAFIGREIYFIVKEIDLENSVLMCSRKEIEDIKKNEIIPKLQQGEHFEGTIVKIMDFGAYVDVEGVTGLLKNTDFSDDYSTIKNELHRGSKIIVKAKRISDNKKIAFEAVEKYSSPTIIDMSILKPNSEQVIEGTVTSILPDRCYVNIGPKIDVLCSIPSTLELEVGLSVPVKIKSIKEIDDQQKVRGKIIEL